MPFMMQRKYCAQLLDFRRRFLQQRDEGRFAGASLLPKPHSAFLCLVMLPAGFAVVANDAPARGPCYLMKLKVRRIFLWRATEWTRQQPVFILLCERRKAGAEV